MANPHGYPAVGEAAQAMSREHLADRYWPDTNQLNRALRRRCSTARARLRPGADVHRLYLSRGLGGYRSLPIDLAMVMVLVIALGRAFSLFGKVQKQRPETGPG